MRIPFYAWIEISNGQGVIYHTADRNNIDCSATSATVVTTSEDRGLVTDSSTSNSLIHTSGNDAGAITDSNIVESDDFGSI